MGPRLVTVPMDWSAAGDAATEIVRTAGFLPVRPSSSSTDPSFVKAIAHRHVAVMVTGPGQPVAAAALVKQLARVSPRGHLVLLFADATGERRARASPHTRAAPPGCRAADDDVRLARLVAERQHDRAEAWLAALRVEADLLGRRLRDNTQRIAVWCRLWQRQPEAAVAACHRIRHAGSRRRLAAVIGRVIPGAPTMFLLSDVPVLLQSMADADDDLCALRAAASWTMAHAPARAVAFVGGDDGQVAAGVGWGSGGPSVGDRLLAVRAASPEQHARGPHTLTIAPVRQAGTRIGSVLVLGAPELAGSVHEAAATLALLCGAALRTRLDQLAAGTRSRTSLPEIVGDSPAMAAVREAVARAAATPFAVLVEGESGTGKELIARALHRLSPRRDRRFVAVNCAALSEELIEAELFGHSRGAFTGAVAPRTGLFEDAHGGTLFLDEVAELSPRAQAKLLRALQEREVRRVGENQARPIDVRVVAATNRPLAEACAAGQFRDDLRFRLAVIRLPLPALRERAEDIAPIARAFWSRTMREVEKRAVIGADALARLARHHWPGNVRELQNVVAGLALVAPARGRVSARHVEVVLDAAGAGPRMPPMSLERARRACERQMVAAALARHAGRRTAAARELGLTRQGLAKIIRRLQLDETAA